MEAVREKTATETKLEDRNNRFHNKIDSHIIPPPRNIKDKFGLFYPGGFRLIDLVIFQNK